MLVRAAMLFLMTAFVVRAADLDHMRSLTDLLSHKQTNASLSTY